MKNPELVLELIVGAALAWAVCRLIYHVVLGWKVHGFKERTLRRWDRRGRIPFWARRLRPKLHFCCELDYALIDEKPEFCSCVKE